MNIKKSLLALGVVSAVAVSAPLMAKVSEKEAVRLGTELTPFGAEKGGNADGTIPAWNPNFQPPAEYKVGGHYVDPYKDEKPLYQVTAKNYQEHADKLTAGQKALFEQYPDTFRIDVYPTHRDAMYSDFFKLEIRKNATRSELTPDGNGVVNAYGSVPFPIPQDPREIVWNSTFNSWPFFSQYVISDFIVYPNGTLLEGVSQFTRIAPYFDPKGSLEEFEAKDLPRSSSIIETLAPTRNKGKAVLVKEYVNQSADPRGAWSYTPGIRRVRRAPTVNYDSPAGLGNWRTTDESYGFNGATDKYDWTLVGKKEILIPYNSYKFESPDVSIEELLTAKHPNPDYMRFELHRVWVLKAELKEGERNVYKTREIYIDEDTWNPVIVDNYDNRDRLWRTAFVNSINIFDMGGFDRRSTIHFDLNSREYFANEIRNHHPAMTVNRDMKELSYFSTSTLRMKGVR